MSEYRMIRNLTELKWQYEFKKRSEIIRKQKNQDNMEREEGEGNNNNDRKILWNTKKIGNFL